MRFPFSPVVVRGIPLRLICFLVLAWLVALPLSGRVVDVRIDLREALEEGRSFGLAGAYESIHGRLFFAVDPTNAANRNIADIDLAPRNGKGEVEFSADFTLFKPRDQGRGNGALLLDVVNRGNPTVSRVFNLGNREEPLGDGLLMRSGYSILMVGWQHDALPGRLRLFAPVAIDQGKSVRGLVRANFTSPERKTHQFLGDRGHRAYPTADEMAEENRLTVLDNKGRARVIPRSEWSFVYEEEGVAFDDGPHLMLKGGFEPGTVYEFVYVAKDPWLAGLGLAAIRDAVGYLVEKGDEDLRVSSESFNRAIAFGSSQSGRFLRTFLYDGFNRDEAGHRVFDGIFANVAGASRGSFNLRFAQPSRSGTYPNRLFPGVDFPFTDREQQDPETGRKGGIQSGTDPRYRPKVFYVNSSNEYWRSAAALIHSSIDGKSDADIPDNVRIYLTAGTGHGPSPFPSERGFFEQIRNPMNSRWTGRALLPSLNAWIQDGIEPPESRYPKISEGGLISGGELVYPPIPGVTFPSGPNHARRVDFGSRYWNKRIMDKDPPELGKAYPGLVSAVDADGNETSGIRLPALVAPLGTFTGWNFFDEASGLPHRFSLPGAFIPFSLTKAERKASGDPRLSIEERYAGREQYLGRVAESAVKLAENGYLLQEDVSRVIQEAAGYWDNLVEGE